jgi:hypothetical protein
MGVERRIAVVAVAACLSALAAGCGGRDGIAGPAVHKEGVRVMQLEGMQALGVYFDRTKAVAMGRDGLYRVDARGRIENGGKPIFEATNIDQFPLIRDGSKTKVVVVLRDGGGIFFVDPERPSGGRRIAPDLKYNQKNLRVYAPGNGLWIGVEGGLDFAVGPDGSCVEIRAADGGGFAWPTNIRYYGDDRTVWYSSVEGGPVRHFVVDPGGLVREFRELRGKGATFVPADGGRHAWAFLEDGLALADADGSLKRIAPFEGRGVQERYKAWIGRKPGRERLWMVSFEGDEAILLDVRGDEIRNPALKAIRIEPRPAVNNPPLMVFGDSNDREAENIWVGSNGGRGLCSIDADGNVRRYPEFDRANFSSFPRPIGATPRFLVGDEANRYYLVAPGGPAVPIPGLTGRIYNYFDNTQDKSQAWLITRPAAEPDAPITMARLDKDGGLELFGPPLGQGNFDPIASDGDGTAYATRSDAPGLRYFRAGGEAGEFESTREARVTAAGRAPDSAETWFHDAAGGWYLFRGGRDLLGGRAIFKEGQVVGAVVAASEGGASGWGSSQGRRTDEQTKFDIYSFTMDVGEEVEATLRFGGEALDSKAPAHAGLRTSPLDAGAPTEVLLNWPGRPRAGRWKGKVSVTVSEEHGPQVAHGFEEFGEDTVKPHAPLPIALHRDGEIQRGKPYRLWVHYGDALGSDFSVTWDNVTFRPPRFTPRQVHTALTYLGIVAAIAFLATDSRLIRPVAPAVARWLPATVAAGGGVAPFLPLASKWDVDGTGLVLALLVTLGLVIPTGLINPAVFRVLARTEPFSRVAPLALRSCRMRRRLLQEFIEDVGRQLRAASAKASHEIYVPTPASVEAPDRPAEVAASPAEHVAGLLAKARPEDRPNVLIESPGGRGKSALLREVARLLLESASPAAPVPVVCTGAAGEVEAMVKAALGRHLLSDDALDDHLRNDDFVLVVDGLSESGLKPEAIREFLRGAHGRATRLVVTTRPDDDYREAIEASDRWVRVEPLRLDDATIGPFEAAYREADARREGRKPSPTLPPGLRAACKGPDGTYLPILVRLAVRGEGGGEGIDSLAGIYENAFLQLLRDPDGGRKVLDEAAALCLETYWKDGYRTLAFATAPPERLDLLDRLADAGILVPADERPRTSANRPRQVKFFHDSMQSYLTAFGLATRDRWDALPRAAGEPTFSRAQSDLSLSEQASELFQMCLNVFDPGRLLDRLREGLRSWAERKGRTLSLDDVFGAVPAHLRAAFEARAGLTPDLGAGRALTIALELCEHADSGDPLANVGGLYARIAPLVWEPPPAASSAPT